MRRSGQARLFVGNPGPVDSTAVAPQQLLDYNRTNCDREFYDSCAKTGDIGRLLLHVRDIHVQAERMAVKIADDDGLGLLQLCAQYQITAQFHATSDSVSTSETRVCKKGDPLDQDEQDWTVSLDIKLHYEIDPGTKVYLGRIVGDGIAQTLKRVSRGRVYSYGRGDSGRCYDVGWNPWCDVPQSVAETKGPMRAEITQLGFIRVGPRWETTRFKEASVAFESMPFNAPYEEWLGLCGANPGEVAFSWDAGLRTFYWGFLEGGLPEPAPWPLVTSWSAESHPLIATRSWTTTKVIRSEASDLRVESVNAQDVKFKLQHLPGAPPRA